MARVAASFLLLWLSVYGCMRGQCRECASGFIDWETLTIGLQVRSRTQQQRIIPQLNFTCNGSLTKWIFAASWNGGNNHNLYPELQIWRPNSSDTYMKVQSSTVTLSQNLTNRYEYIPSSPIKFQAGDIIGIFQPSQARSRLYMQYYQGNIYSQLISYYFQTRTTSQFQSFSSTERRVMSEYILPLITVEINSQSTGVSLCTSRFLSEEALTRLTVLIGQRNRAQRIIPTLRFDCDGAITKWIVGASWNNAATSFPDLQIWRLNSSENGVYNKVSSTTLNATRHNSSRLYEFAVEPFLPFQTGDILGIFQPRGSRSRLRVLYRTGSGNPLNYVFRPPQNVTEPPLETFTTSSSGIIRQTVLPLVTMKISRSMSAVTQLLLTATARVKLSPTSTTSSRYFSSMSRAATSIVSGTPATSHLSSTPATSHLSSTPATSHLSSTPATSHLSSTPATSHLSSTPATSHLSSTPATSHLLSTPATSHLSSTPATSHLSSTPATSRLSSTPATSRLSSTPTTSHLLSTPATSHLSSTPATSHLSSTPATSHLSSTPATSHLSSTPATSHLSSTPATSHLSSTPAASHLSSTPATSHLSSTPATSHLSSTPATSHLLSTPATFLTSGTPVSPMTSVSSPSSELDNMEGSFSVSTVGTVAGVGGSFLLAVIIVVLVITVLLLFRRRKKYFVSSDTDEHILHNPTYGQVDILSVGSTKTSELNANGACGSPSKDSEYELVRGRGASAKIELNFSNPLYAEPERVIACEIYESSNLDAASLEWGFCVPTEEQRRNLSSLSESDLYSTVYSDVNTHPAKEQVFFQESNIYWAPSSNPTELYAQLAKYKFREILSLQIKTTDHLGSGQFGSVDKGVWTSPNGQVEVAVKQLKEGTSEADRVKFLKEAAIMGQFQHPNVIKLHGVVTMADPAMIILEFMSNGDLRDYLIKNRPSPGEMTTPETPKLCLKFCHQVASGMEYLAGKAFVHRDIAARNILVSAERNCKIADFGMARDLEESEYYISQGGKVPVKWTAPEAINFKKYSIASDVWSFGALLFEIWSLGHKPFEEYTNLEVLHLVGDGYRLSPPPGCPKAIYTLMTNCWHPDPVARPTFSELCQALSQPESELLGWSEEDMRVHPQAAVLGAPLEAGKHLYCELQEIHISRDN